MLIFILLFVYVKIKTKKHYLHIKPFLYYIIERMYKKNVTWIYYTERYDKDKDTEKEYLTIKY